MSITINKQSSIFIDEDKKIYFDPYEIEEETNDADFIFITHDHYDHFDPKSIRKIINRNTILIIPRPMEEQALRLTKNIKVVDPNYRYEISSLRFETTPSYNIKKRYHPKKKKYVAYNVEIANKKYFVLGDTDCIPEIEDIPCDVCFVPIGGTYTMDVYEAINYINRLKPKVAIPIHYGSIVGDASLGEIFKQGVNKDIEVELYIK